MSTRVMKDGRPYNRTQATEVRPYHRPEEGEPWWRCKACGSTWHWVQELSGVTYRRHDPGTFWERGR